ncbi:MAG TPA: response regulator [Thermomicrobiaceae bacterium]|nr:response regulator [Thermomicrobiaceae bacterium]
MAQARILLVESDIMRAQQLAQALQARLFTRPDRVASAEAALEWLADNACDACLLAYRLPGMDGLQALVRIHQRAPSLPVVMLSNAGSEQAAIAAFRAGVTDYLPIAPGIADVAARRVEEILRHLPSSSTSVASVPDNVPPQLLEPTYQNRLRTIGHQLDVHGYRFPNVLEVDGGFLVVATPDGSRAQEALEFADRDFTFLVASAIGTRSSRAPEKSGRQALFPTGYEDFLRALGWRLDTDQAEAITVSELDDGVVVGGRRHRAGAAGGQFRRFHEFLGPDEVAALLDEAFRHRRSTPGKSGRWGRS